MASTVIDPIADALVAVVEALTPNTRGILWSQVETDTRPAAVVGMPEVRRTDPDASEDHIGAFDWNLRYPVDFYFDFDEPTHSQAQAVEVIEAFIRAIDADSSLGILADAGEAKVIEAGPPEKVTTDQSRALIFYPCTVAVLAFVA